jgi:hypothetical protein
MESLERNTDWKAAAAISLGAGMVTGLVFAMAGPFFSSWLQPTADELFGRKPSPTLACTAAVQQPGITINNTTNNFCSAAPQAGKPVSNVPPQTGVDRPKGKLSCKSLSANAYGKSLKELLEQGDTVTLDMNGKKISMCYRPRPMSVTSKAKVGL